MKGNGDKDYQTHPPSLYAYNQAEPKARGLHSLLGEDFKDTFLIACTKCNYNPWHAKEPD